MIEYQLMILCVLLGMALIALVNVVSFKSVQAGLPVPDPPMVSILMPARNEERSIGTALASLSEQDYPRFEVVVIDDNSEDGTARIAADWALRDGRIRLVRGKPLPPGWVGKAFACHQLSQQATGELLLFVDADTLLGRESVRGAVAELVRVRAGLLTVIPRQMMQSFWETVVLPLLHFSTFCYLPMPLVTTTRSPKIAMANGQFMLFRTETYRAIGGHESVRNALVEDVWLSRLVKQNGSRLAIRDGGELVRCRMYRSFREIWEGFSKNLFAGFRYSLPVMVAVVLFNALTSIGPFVFSAAGLVIGRTQEPWWTLAVCQVAVLLLIRLALAYRFRLSPWASFLHPAAVLVFIGIALNSCLWVLTGGGSRWKGRLYDFRHHTVPEQPSGEIL